MKRLNRKGGRNGNFKAHNPYILVSFLFHYCLTQSSNVCYSNVCYSGIYRSSHLGCKAGSRKSDGVIVFKHFSSNTSIQISKKVFQNFYSSCSVFNLLKTC